MTDAEDSVMQTSVQVHGPPMLDDIEDDFEREPISTFINVQPSVRTDGQSMLPPNPDRFEDERYMRRMFFYVMGEDFRNNTGNNRAEAFFRSLTRRDRTALRLFGWLIHSQAEFSNPYHPRRPDLKSASASAPASAPAPAPAPGPAPTPASDSAPLSAPASLVASASVSAPSMETESEAEALAAARAAMSTLASTLSSGSNLLPVPQRQPAPERTVVRSMNTRIGFLSNFSSRSTGPYPLNGLGRYWARRNANRRGN
jgi:hypothetical protein